MKYIVCCLVLVCAGSLLYAADFRNTAAVEVQTRLDQDGASSVLVEDTLSRRISPRVTLLARGLYQFRDGNNFSGAGLGGVIVLKGGWYSELMYTLQHYGGSDYLHRLYADATYESASWLGNISSTFFITDDSFSSTLASFYRYFWEAGNHLQLRYILGIIPEADELLAHTGLMQYAHPLGAYRITLGGGGGTFGDEGTIKLGWTVYGELGRDITDRTRLSYGASYNSSDDEVRQLANRIILSSRW